MYSQLMMRPLIATGAPLLTGSRCFPTAMVLSYSCALLTLTLCATPPSLGSAKSATGYRAAAPLKQQHTQQRGRLGLNEEGCALPPLSTTSEPAASGSRRRDNQWWWGGRGGLSRIGAARGGRCLAKLRKDAAALARREHGGQLAGGLEAALGLARCVNPAAMAHATESTCVAESCTGSETGVTGNHTCVLLKVEMSVVGWVVCVPLWEGNMMSAGGLLATKRSDDLRSAQV